MTASPTDDLASAERRVQELTKELSQARGELSQARGELAGAREQQATTAEILRVISSSPKDLQPVFAEIAASAARLCDAYDAVILQVAGDDILRVVAHHGPIPPADTLPLTRGVATARAVLDRQTIHIPDLQAEAHEYPESRKIALQVGFRTALAVPLVLAGEAIGAIFIRRGEVRPFTDRQIDLLKTFADQAVIAIENTRLFEEVQARTGELQESLEYQTATSDVLNIISRSTTEVQPVFDAIVKSAARLFDPCMISIVSLEGHQLIYRASASARYEQNIETFQSLYPMPFDPERRPASRAILEKRIVEIPDAAAPDVSESMRNAQKAVGTFRSLTLVPLIREGQGIGIISLAHPEPGFKLSHKQLALVQTFADQAVIAIENTRLFEAAQARTHELTERTQELTETLEYQTAVSEVLGVISRSPNQLQPVLDTIVQTAQRLCQSDRAQFFRLENGKYHLAAQRGTNPEFLRHLAENPISPEPGSGTTTSKAAREHRTIHVPDVLTDSEFAHGDRAGRGRSILAVPLIRDDVVIGVITVAQDAVRPFSDREIKLVETFAKQALIAIENTRLFEAEQVSKHKLQESLEYQTATSEVLKTISRSTFDLRAVLDTLISSAIRLCQAEEALIWTLTDNTFRLAAKKGIRPECEKFALEHPPKVDRSSISGRAVLEGRTIHIPDVLADSEYQWRGAQAQEVGKFRSLLCVPLLREKIAFGTTVLSRNTVQPFSDKQIELVSTFADQALIAIENTRLFEAEQASKRELQESLEYQTANSDVLAVISRSPNELQPVLDAIVQTALSLCPSDRALVMLPQVDGYRVVARAGSTPKQKQTQGLMPVDRGSVFGRVALEGRTIHVEDVRSDPDYTLPVDDRRTVLGVPLLRDGNIAGVILLLRTRSSLSANARSSS